MEHFAIGKVDEYRIGGYVVTKFKKPLLGEFLIFEPFFGAGEVNAVLEKNGSKTEVVYRRDQEPIRISRFYRSNIRIGNLIFVKWKERKLWERGRFFDQAPPPSASA